MSEVPSDPDLYFYGKEIAMSAGLWTSGFNIYAPNRLLLFHLYIQNVQTIRIQPPIGAITAIGTTTIFAHSNVYTHCLALSTMPLRQSIASMINLRKLNPLD